MPLIVLSGYPSSGKSFRANELKESVLKKKPGTKVILVDDGNINRNEIYSERKCEIFTRSSLKSAAERNLTNSNIVIVDSLNYVKGFRYELFCVAKYARSTHCVIQCDASTEDVYKQNAMKNCEERYSDSVLQALIDRFESPNPMARWDSPLFTIQTTDQLPIDDILQALFEKNVPKPNMSTQNPPLMSPSFVHEADQILQGIAAAIISGQKTADIGDSIHLPGVDDSYILKHKIPLPEMRRKRKEFMSYLRANPVSDVSQVSKTFLYFLNS